MSEPIDILEDRLLHDEPGLLEVLLVDHSTQKNIFWATDSYLAEGEGYGWHDCITVSAITGKYGSIIMPRALKSRDEQQRRSRQMAEVFTPAWLVKKMNDVIDEEGSHAKDGLKDEFEPWQRYVLTMELEITCGEAPFLTSRYDSVTAEPIPVEERVGLLDRKLQRVNKFAIDAEWTRWALLALANVYGYEWQGDNLLLAREALLATFVEYHEHRFGCRPASETIRKAAEIIAWNVWQMDGLKAVVPASCHDEKRVDAGLFETIETITPCPGCAKDDVLAHNGQRCRLRRWLPSATDIPDYFECNYTDFITKKYKTYHKRKRLMRFDFVVGNPPFNDDTLTIETANGQHPTKSIFQYFQQEADKIARFGSCLIYPGGRWMQRSGKGMQQFGLMQINDKHLSSLYFYPNSTDLFGDAADLTDGISIVLKRYTKDSSKFNYHYCPDVFTDICVEREAPGKTIIELNPNDSIVMNKVDAFVKKHQLKVLHERILPRSLFSIESDFVEKNPQKVTLMDGSEPLSKGEIKLLTNDKAGKAGRAKWYKVSKDVIPSSAFQYINKYKVIVSSANAGGVKRDNQIEIVDNKSAFGRVRIALAVFDTKQEADNFLAYCKSYVIRFAFLMTDDALSSLAMRVPDLGDYTINNKLIDFSEDINSQLFSLMKFTDEEKRYIKATIDNIDIKRNK